MVRVELPQDVPGAEPAADAEHHRLAQRLARVRRDDAEVREHVRERGGVAVEPAAELPRGVAADDVATGDGVALAGLAHAFADEVLEVLSSGHGVSSKRRRRPGSTRPWPTG